MESNLNDPAFSNSISKKELLQLTREKEKLHLNLGGIKDLNGKPDLMVIFDVMKDKLAVLEAKKLGIPIIGIVDTNCDPDLIDYPIPANDDGVKSVQFILDSFKKVLSSDTNENTSDVGEKNNE